MSKANPCEGCTYFSIAERQITFTEDMSQQLLSEFSGSMETGARFDQNRQVAEELGLDYDSLPTAPLRSEVQGIRKAIDGMAEAVLSVNEEKAKTAQSFIDEANAACSGVQKYGFLRRQKLCGLPIVKQDEFIDKLLDR